MTVEEKADFDFLLIVLGVVGQYILPMNAKPVYRQTRLSESRMGSCRSKSRKCRVIYPTLMRAGICGKNSPRTEKSETQKRQWKEPNRK